MNALSCARPACSGEPEAWFAYDYEARCAWLDDAPAPSGTVSHQWPLCARHADNLRVPRGWFCVDRRAKRSSAREGVAGEQPELGAASSPPTVAARSARHSPTGPVSSIL
ncbi:MAG TPA: DUF3499 family protein [Acidimicrobiales bacterium]|nr:DUF3499 family protein [Acidimicrobiales bacterium]